MAKKRMRDDDHHHHTANPTAAHAHVHTADPRLATLAAPPSAASVRLTPREILHLMRAPELVRLLDAPQQQLFAGSCCGDIQRNLDADHLDALKRWQAKHCADFGCYAFTSQWVLAQCDGRYALVDGQHRLEALRYLLRTDAARASGAIVPVLVVDLVAPEEYDRVFEEVNQSKPVRLYRNVGGWKTVLKRLEQHFTTWYRPYLKRTCAPMVPHLNLDRLLEYMDEGDYVRRVGIDADAWIREVEALNACYRLHWRDLIKRAHMPRVEAWARKCEEKAPTRSLYLGLFRQFEWVDRIAQRVALAREAVPPQSAPAYEQMAHVPIGVRVRVGKSLRRNVWIKRHPTKPLRGACYVCARPIEYDEFDCGHVVSVFAGGPTTLTNLEPVCKGCNQEMGVEHLEEYKRRTLAAGGGWRRASDGEIDERC